jgi:hypothetical protein
MTVIANPIYDTVFKYLLEDLDIAREMLSVLLGRDIIHIEMKPQEVQAEISSESLTVFRVDFKAIVRLSDGRHEKVLIELQKAKHLLDITRFRKYLGDNYQRSDLITLPDGTVQEVPLHIVAMYFLGFTLSDHYPKVFKSKPVFTDVITGEVLDEGAQVPFLDLLHHESFVVQIPRLDEGDQTRVEKILSVFNQEQVLEDDQHRLRFIKPTDDPLVERMVYRLLRAVADDDLRKRMDVEDEVENTIFRLIRERDLVIESKEKAISEKEKTISEKEKTISEKEKTISEKEKTISEKDKAIEEKDALIAELMRRLDTQP